MGAWIETTMMGHTIIILSVALYMGAWIETTLVR